VPPLFFLRRCARPAQHRPFGGGFFRYTDFTPFACFARFARALARLYGFESAAVAFFYLVVVVIVVVSFVVVVSFASLPAYITPFLLSVVCAVGRSRRTDGRGANAEGARGR
jgi:hypothetical protein